MEKIVTVVSSLPLQKNEWKNPRTGETKLIKSKKIVVTDGVDTFECEATNIMAEEIEDNPLERNFPYRMQFQMTVKEKERENTGEKYNITNIRLLNYGEL